MFVYELSGYGFESSCSESFPLVFFSVVKLLSCKEFVYDLQKQYKILLLDSNSKTVHKKLQFLLRKSNLLCTTTGSCLQVFFKKRDLKNFVKFTGQDLCWSLFLKKVSGLTPVTLLNMRLQQGCYPVKLAKFL